jgi:hypothetical protein
MPGPRKPAPRPVPKASRGGGRAGAPVAKRPGQRRFEVDRIVVLRVALAVVVLLFLYLILRVAIVAFGGGGANQAKRVERIVEEATATKAGAPAAKASEAPTR